MASRTLRLMLVVAATLLTGCGEEQQVVFESEDGTKQAPARHHVAWLDIETDLPPEQWLVSRNEDTLRAATDPDVQRVKQLLETAHRLYRESERMIANRTVQIEDMLNAKGHDDRAIGILQDLAEVPGEAGQTEGYGSIGQHYVNLRGEGLSRVDALAELKRLYGKRP